MWSLKNQQELLKNLKIDIKLNDLLLGFAKTRKCHYINWLNYVLNSKKSRHYIKHT